MNNLVFTQTPVHKDAFVVIDFGFALKAMCVFR